MKSDGRGTSRRGFFKLAGTAGVLAGSLGRASASTENVLPTPRANTKKFQGGKFPKPRLVAKGRVLGANDRILVGHVGLGNMGTAHLNDFHKQQKEWNTQSAGLCDVYG